MRLFTRWAIQQFCAGFKFSRLQVRVQDSNEYFKFVFDVRMSACSEATYSSSGPGHVDVSVLVKEFWSRHIVNEHHPHHCRFERVGNMQHVSSINSTAIQVMFERVAKCWAAMFKRVAKYLMTMCCRKMFLH